MSRVTIRIVEVQRIGCLVDIAGRQYEHVLIPYADLHAGQEFEARCLRDAPLHLVDWQCATDNKKGSAS